MRKSLLVLAVVALVMVAGTAMADPIGGNASGISWTGTLTNTSLSITINTSGCTFTNCNDFAGFSFQGWDTSTFHLVSTTQSAGWSAGIPGKDASASCTNSNSGSVCWLPTAGEPGVANGTYTFTATVSGTTVLANPSLIATFDTGESKTHAGKTTYTQAGQISVGANDCATNCTSTPEPASLMLLGAGMLGLGGLIRRRK